MSELFDGFHAKQGRDENGRYVTSHFFVALTSAIFVDDHPEDLPLDADVVAVRPYLSHSPHDCGLRVVARRAGVAIPNF
jgi:hypothetical protein